MEKKKKVVLVSQDSMERSFREELTTAKPTTSGFASFSASGFASFSASGFASFSASGFASF